MFVLVGHLLIDVAVFLGGAGHVELGDVQVQIDDSLEEIQRSIHVHVNRFVRAFPQFADVCLCSEMENYAVEVVSEPFESLLYGMLVTEIASMDLDFVSEVADISEFAMGRTDENVYVCAELDETFCEMRADESVSACYEYR